MTRRKSVWSIPRFGGAAHPGKYHRRLTVRPRLEQLEPRQLLACDAVPIGEMVFEEIYREDFEAGDGGFVVDNTGQNLPGLWHRTAGRRFDGLDNHSPLHSFYYGTFETAFGNGHYVLTDSHRGTITSPPIALPDGGTTLLNFSYLLDTRPELDRDFVSVSVIDGGDVIEILSRQDGSLPETPVHQWSTADYDLSAFNGKAIQLEFLFDTGAIPRIDPEGWYVDDIVILHSGTADLSIDKDIDDSTPNVGQSITYTLTASNSPTSQVTADCVSVTDILPTGLTIVDVVPSAGSYDPGTGLWSDFELARGESQTLVIRATVDPGTAGMMLSNTATIESLQDDPDPSNNIDTEILTVNSVDVAISKTSTDETPNEGQTFSYTLLASNAASSNAPATNVLVQETLPAGVTFVSASSDDFDINTQVWNVGELAAGTSESLTIVVTVNAGFAGATLTNTATIGGDETDPDATNNTFTHVAIVNSVDLTISKTSTDETPNEGQTFSYTLVASNAASSNASASNVLVQETLPAGVTFVSASSADFDINTQVWNVGELAVGTSESLTIIVTVNAGFAGATLTNTATIGGDETDPNVTNNTVTHVAIVNSVDLAVSKSSTDETPNEGQTFSYTLVASNAASSNAPATNVLVQETLPAGVTFVSASSDDFDIDTQVWNVGQLAAGTSESLTIVVTVNAGFAGATLTNTATIGGGETDPDATNNAATHVSVVNSVDLAISKTSTDETPNEGQTLSYTLVASNAASSNAPATNVLVQETLPAGVTFVSASSDDFDINTQVWNIGELAAGASETLTIVVTVDAGFAGESLTNTAIIGGGETDPDATNNTVTQVSVVNSVDLAISKTSTDETPNEGQTFSYTLVASNAASSNAPATNVLVQETLPAGVTFVSASSDDFDINTQVWDVGELAAGASETLTIVVTVNAGSAGASLTNTATIGGGETDPDATNNAATHVSVVNSVDLAISKTSTDETPNEGQTFSYTLVASNAASSNAPATNVLVQETLPAGVTFVSASSADFDINTQVWNVGELAAGTSESLTIVVTVNAGFTGASLTNTATIGGGETDPDATNNAATHVSVVNSVDLAISKTSTDETPNEGQTFSYTLVASNAASSNAPATNVLVQETLPAGVTLVSASSADFDINTQVWNVGELAAGTSESLTIVVTVNAGFTGATLTNTATIGGDETDPDSTNNTVTQVSIVNSVDLAVTKSASISTPTEGQIFTYTITVSNAPGANAAATGVIVEDALPAGVSFVSAAASEGTYDSATSIWHGVQLLADETQTLVLTVRADAGTAGQSLVNTVSVDGNETDPNPVNNQASATVNVVEPTVQSVQFISPLSVFREGRLSIPAEQQLAILGRVWHDQNGNGQWDAGEPGLDGASVELIDPSASGGPLTIGVAQSSAADLNQDGVIDPVTERGLYWFQQVGQIPLGTYTLRLQLPTGETTSFPAGNSDHTLVLDAANPSLISSALQSAAPNFGVGENFVQSPADDRASIVGYAWADLDLNGIWDTGELARSGQQFFLDLNNDGSYDPEQLEPAAITGADGKFVFADLEPGTYTILESDLNRLAVSQQSFPSTPGHTVSISGGESLAGAFGEAESPNFGKFEYGLFVRPADQLLARFSAPVQRALQSWQSFQIENTTGADFAITDISTANVSGRGADFLTIKRLTDGSLSDPVFPLTLADGESAVFMAFYDPAIRSGAAVSEQFPDWLGTQRPVHTFDPADRLTVLTDAGPTFSIRLIGGSTFDSDVSYDGIVDLEDIGLLDDLLLRERVIVEGQSPRFDPTMDINARCPNGADQVTGSCSFAIGGTPAREIAYGDFGPLNVEFGRQRDALPTAAASSLVITASGESSAVAQIVEADPRALETVCYPHPTLEATTDQAPARVAVPLETFHSNQSIDQFFFRIGRAEIDE